MTTAFVQVRKTVFGEFSDTEDWFDEELLEKATNIATSNNKKLKTPHDHEIRYKDSEYVTIIRVYEVEELS